MPEGSYRVLLVEPREDQVIERVNIRPTLLGRIHKAPIAQQ